jgi:hypothetical protein
MGNQVNQFQAIYVFAANTGTPYIPLNAGVRPLVVVTSRLSQAPKEGFPNVPTACVEPDRTAHPTYEAWLFVLQFGGCAFGHCLCLYPAGKMGRLNTAIISDTGPESPPGRTSAFFDSFPVAR